MLGLRPPSDTVSEGQAPGAASHPADGEWLSEGLFRVPLHTPSAVWKLFCLSLSEARGATRDGQEAASSDVGCPESPKSTLLTKLANALLAESRHVERWPLSRSPSSLQALVAGDQSPGGESIFLPFIWQIRPGALAAFAADHADAVCSRRAEAILHPHVTGRLGAGASLSAPPIPSRQALLHEAAATVLNKLELCSSPFQQLSAGSGQCPSHHRRTELLGGLPGVGGAHHHHTGICRALAMQALHAQKTH